MMTKQQVRAVCEFCGRKSRWQDGWETFPNGVVRVSLYDLAAGWSVAPYAPAFVHPTGTHGDKWTCPACRRRGEAGATLYAQPVECTETRAVKVAG